MRYSKSNLSTHGIDPELLAMSGTLEQYNIDMEKLATRFKEMYGKKSPTKKRRRNSLKKSAKKR